MASSGNEHFLFPNLQMVQKVHMVEMNLFLQNFHYFFEETQH